MLALSINRVNGDVLIDEFLVEPGTKIRSVISEIEKSVGGRFELVSSAGEILFHDATVGDSVAGSGGVLTAIASSIGWLVWSTNGAFFALLENKKVVAWGDTFFGADISSVKDQLETNGISQIWVTYSAFFALLESKKVVAWGDIDDGTDIDILSVKDQLETDGISQI